ncbi:MAG: hypothetical protein DRH26_13870 [Deltaproteobacteria bacterium]|nr:MAG: hypothetical protein DRH26_13870 [Deltaproteobacteria bacterium]
MNFKKIIESTFNQLLKNIVPLIITTLVLMGVSVLSFGILAPVMLAGYTKSILDMVRIGREPTPRDVFSQLGLFLPLSLFTLALFIVVAIGFFLLFLPGLIIVLAVTFYLIYMIPLMVDKNLGLVDAGKESISLVRHTSFFDHLILVVLYSIVQSLGGSTLLGTVITIPISTIFLMIAYDQVVNS